MKTIENALMSVAIEAQEREIAEQEANAKRALDMRLSALVVLEEQFRGEFEEIASALRERSEKLKSAKRAMGFGVRSVSGLLD